MGIIKDAAVGLVDLNSPGVSTQKPIALMGIIKDAAAISAAPNKLGPLTLKDTARMVIGRQEGVRSAMNNYQHVFYASIGCRA
jgi:hypothetical protein